MQKGTAMSDQKTTVEAKGCIAVLLLLFLLSGSAIAWGGLIAWMLR
jgi:hypothetical protein